jgi:hypothetical protein
MCFEPLRDEAEREAKQTDDWRQEVDRDRATARSGPATGPGPRGNQETDEADVERSVEKLMTLVGR